jgi:hypothetical protein
VFNTTPPRPHPEHPPGAFIPVFIGHARYRLIFIDDGVYVLRRY